MDKKRAETSLLRAGRPQSFKAGSRASIRRMRAFGRSESGAVAIFTAIILAVLLGMVALVVDIGHLATVKNELQNAADAAALAGARALVFTPGEPVQQFMPLPDTPYCSQAVQWAQNTINQSDAQNLVINLVQTGVWDWQSNTFTASEICQAGVNAVHVVVQRNDSANQPITTWFARIFGVDTMSASAQATAALGNDVGQCSGWGPIALTKDWFDAQEAPLSTDTVHTIMFYPDQTDDGGWCSTYQNPTPPELINAITTENAGNCLSTDDSANSSVYLNNGNLVPGIKAVKQEIQNYTEPDGTKPGYWPVCLPVLRDLTMTDQLNQTGIVDGFVNVRITGAYTPNDPQNPTQPPSFVITFEVDPDQTLVKGANSGYNASSNLYGTEPRLVN
jgi:Flp pilus assembly protein TadG